MQIAGVDKAFEDLDLENGKEEGDDVGSEAGEMKKVIAPETKVKREGEVEEEDEEEEGSEETLNEREAGQDKVQEQEGEDKDEDEDDDAVNEDHPVYQYTLALFEYTVSLLWGMGLEIELGKADPVRRAYADRNDNTWKRGGNTRGSNVIRTDAEGNKLEVNRAVVSIHRASVI